MKRDIGLLDCQTRWLLAIYDQLDRLKISVRAAVVLPCALCPAVQLRDERGGALHAPYLLGKERSKKSIGKD